VLEKVEQHINKDFPFLKKAKLLIAVSGGVDSMTVLSILKTLGYNVALAHCNFKLRGKDSELDEQFVQNWAQKNKIKCYIKQFDTSQYAHTNKISIQLAARELRYQWFDTLLKKECYDFVITAHHANDNFETVLFNLTRGTGFKGMLGIPDKNDKIIRPFLPFTKYEIAEYAKENNIAWREDISNASEKYSRNKIRHKVIPVLESLNPQLIKSFNKSLEHFKAKELICNDYLTELKKRIFKIDEYKTINISIKAVLKLSQPKMYLYELLNEFGFTAWDDVADLLNAQSGKQIFSKTHRLLKNRKKLIITPLLDNESCKSKAYTISNLEIGLILENLNLRFEDVEKEDFKKNSNTDCVFVDKDKIKGVLTVRKWQKGDYFYPFGMQGKKKISTFFKDQKMSLLDKENTWLLTVNKDIVWVLGKRLDNRFKITEQTKNILKINFKK
jgi:tRNA(Ile)-lysidine synthase